MTGHGKGERRGVERRGPDRRARDRRTLGERFDAVLDITRQLMSVTDLDALLLTIGYTGPVGTSYTGITAAQRSQAIALKTSLDNYDNGGFCHT